MAPRVKACPWASQSVARLQRSGWQEGGTSEWRHQDKGALRESCVEYGSFPMAQPPPASGQRSGFSHGDPGTLARTWSREAPLLSGWKGSQTARPFWLPEGPSGSWKLPLIYLQSQSLRLPVLGPRGWEGEGLVTDSAVPWLFWTTPLRMGTWCLYQPLLPYISVPTTQHALYGASFCSRREFRHPFSVMVMLNSCHGRQIGQDQFNTLTQLTKLYLLSVLLCVMHCTGTGEMK